MTQERPSWRWRDAHRASADRVTTVEVFFDVVFVFTLTQLTRILEADLSLAGVGRILLLFGILWWMFDGYVWLPNQVPPQVPVQKLLLFAAMAGFLIAAVGMPHAFGETGVVFAVGYLVVTSVHLLLFTQADIGRALAGWRRITSARRCWCSPAGSPTAPPGTCSGSRRSRCRW
jgi:low temperature requirement protein LtrA